MATSKQSGIKKAVETKIADLLKKHAVAPTKEELQVLTLGVKYLAVAAKLDEGDWGKELADLEEAEPGDENEE
jgi:hypothetical protein